MARDKRTRRTDARRRRREELRAASADPGSAAPAEVDLQPKPRSLLDTLAPWLRLPDIGADLRAVPWIARHTLAFVLPIAAVVVTFVVALDPSVFLLQTQPGDSAIVVLGRAMYQFLLLPPPVTVVFVAAVLAPRAGWLVGAIVGLVSTALFLVLLGIHGPAPYFAFALTPQVAIQTLSVYLPIYVLLGAFASWYRRFLMGMQARTRQRAEERRKEQARNARRAKTGAHSAPVRR